MTARERKTTPKIDPVSASEDIHRYFEGRSPSEIVARAERMTPAPHHWHNGDTSLSQLASEVSWQLLLAADSASEVPPQEAARFGLDFFARLDDTLAFIDINNASSGTDIERLGYVTRRYLTSQRRELQPVLGRLASSKAYKALRGTLEELAASSSQPEREVLDETRHQFAALALVLEDAIA